MMNTLKPDKSMKQSSLSKYKKLQERLAKKGKEVIITPEGLPKISAVFIDFMEPYRFFLENSENRLFYVMIGTMAWNLSFIPKKHYKKELHCITDTLKAEMTNLDQEDQKEIRDSIAKLVERKLKYFADDPRYIEDFELTGDDEEFRIAIACSFL